MGLSDKYRSIRFVKVVRFAGGFCESCESLGWDCRRCRRLCQLLVFSYWLLVRCVWEKVRFLLFSHLIVAQKFEFERSSWVRKWGEVGDLIL